MLRKCQPVRWSADIGVGSLTHRAGADIACETVCHIEQRGHAGRAGLPLALRANAPASPPNIAAFRMPVTSRWSASTAWSPLPRDTTRPNSLSGPTFGPSARVRAPCYGPESYQCFASVSQCAVAQRLVSARLRIVLDENRVDRGTCDSPPLRPPASPPFGFT